MPLWSAGVLKFCAACSVLVTRKYMRRSLVSARQWLHFGSLHRNSDRSSAACVGSAITSWDKGVTGGVTGGVTAVMAIQWTPLGCGCLCQQWFVFHGAVSHRNT
jgi:hypothetical protein